MSGGTISHSELQEAYDKLKQAVTDYGLSVMQTSGKWSLHETNEAGREREQYELKIVNDLVDLEIEVVNLRNALKRTEADKMILCHGLRKAEDFLREVAWLAGIDEPNPDPEVVIEALSDKFALIKEGLAKIENNTLEVMERLKEKDAKLKWYQETLQGIVREKLEGGV